MKTLNKNMKTQEEISELSQRMYIHRLLTEIASLKSQLQRFSQLELKGNIYGEMVPEDHYSVAQFIRQIDPEGVDIYDIFKMNFSKNESGQHRDMSKYNRHRMLLKLCGTIGKDYKRTHKRASPRVKVSKNTSELLQAKSGILNVYPIEYKTMVVNFLAKYPLKIWEKEAVFEDEEGDNPLFEKVEEGYLRCIVCDTVIKIRSKSNHVKSKNHAKHLKSVEIKIECEEEE